jgi:hypothetical protein
MAVVIVTQNLSHQDINQARQDYQYYIKITIDLNQHIIAIGGEYHADAAQLLTHNHQSQSQHIWGGGYNIKTHSFETNALINIKPGINPNMEILDPETRQQFLDLTTQKLSRLTHLS